PDLIQAALRYFLGDRGIHRLSYTRTEGILAGTQETIADPWFLDPDFPASASHPGQPAATTSMAFQGDLTLPLSPRPNLILDATSRVTKRLSKGNATPSGTIALPGTLPIRQMLQGTFQQWVQQLLAKRSGAIVKPTVPLQPTGELGIGESAIGESAIARAGDPMELVVTANSQQTGAALSAQSEIAGAEISGAAIARSHSSHTVWEAEYLEAEVTEMGYEQSWWEQFLQGCDRIFLWLEQAAIIVWQVLWQVLWQGLQQGWQTGRRWWRKR
ncbi:MAG: hypothetical protein VKJ24_08215, partial [Synechococcales bacterium]|nr:hypothetical protein [Synechococcales bacterium]